MAEPEGRPSPDEPDLEADHASVDLGGTDPDPVSELESLEEDTPTRTRLIVRIVVRVLVMLVAIAAATALLAWAFDDLDPQAIFDAIRALDDAERIALISGAFVMVYAEALNTAAVVPRLPARRGALAWLGPTAVASVIPGPSDMPVRYKMYASWGYDGSTAATAIAASAVLNFAMKLVLPPVAAIGLAVSGIDLGTIGSVLVTGLVIVAVFLAAVVTVVISESRTRAVGRVVERLWHATLRLFRRRRDRVEIAEWLVGHRSDSIEILRGRWPRAIATVMFVTVARVALLVMCLRFVGLPDSVVSWQLIFCVWAIQRGLTILPIVPGGAGVTEIALVGLLSAIAGGEYVNEITAGVLVFRVLTWLVIIPAGGAALGLWRWGLRKVPSGPGTGDAGGGPRTV